MIRVLIRTVEHSRSKEKGISSSAELKVDIMNSSRQRLNFHIIHKTSPFPKKYIFRFR
jgi:hypothetical protein